MAAYNGTSEDVGPDASNGSKRTHETKKTCFIMMPVSEVEPYQRGHFKRVYEYIIKPACKNAGFKPIREDEINNTSHIIIDVLKQIIEADMAICDLSSQNPSVLYQLAVRQAFNLPVTLLKDNKTARIFDIQGWRDVQYDANMRIDKIEETIPELTHALKNAYKDEGRSVNSIIQLLGIEPASVTKTEISKDTELLLKAIDNVNRRLNRIENQSHGGDSTQNNFQPLDDRFVMLGDKLCNIGDKVVHPSYGEGVITNFSNSEAIVKFADNYIRFLLNANNSLATAELKAL